MIYKVLWSRREPNYCSVAPINADFYIFFKRCATNVPQKLPNAKMPSIMTAFPLQNKILIFCGAEGSDTYAVSVSSRPVFRGFSAKRHECATRAKPVYFLCKGSCTKPSDLKERYYPIS